MSQRGRRNKGSRFEREVAAEIGAKRTPLSGAAGGNDLLIPEGSVWDVWGVECKRRATLPVFVTHSLDQAELALGIASRRRPAVIMREDSGRSIFVAYLSDVRTWAESLAEMGQGHKVKTLARQATAILRQLEELA